MEKKIINYIILTGNSAFDLEFAVREHLKQRWIPHGGAFIDPHNNYCQTMIKYLCNHHSEQIGGEWICQRCGENV